MFSLKNKKNLSLNYPQYPFLSGALGLCCLQIQLFSLLPLQVLISYNLVLFPKGP